MVWQETFLIATVLFVATEQRPPVIYVDPETELLAEIRPIRSATQQDEFSFVTSESSEQNPETSTVFPEEIVRLLRSLNDKEDTLSSDATTVSTTSAVTTISSDDSTKTQSSTTEDNSTEGNEGFFAIFVKMSSRAVEGLVQKRSVEYLDEDKSNADNLEDLDTAANTVFRPLFAYRQQNAQRRRLRTLQYA